MQVFGDRLYGILQKEIFFISSLKLKKEGRGREEVLRGNNGYYMYEVLR